MKKSAIALILFAALNQVDADSFHHEWQTSGSNWYERWTAMEKRANQMSDQEKITGFTGILGAPVSTLSEKEAALYYRIRNILLNTPGHATYYLDRWKESRHNSETRFMFQYFRNLPSPETVGVLGELLADEYPRPKLADDASNIDEVLAAYPNCDQAVEALHHLLQDPPTEKGRYNFPTDLKIWREWYERVKAGRQTFRFVGDPTHYTLRGPSERGAIEPGPRDTRRSPSTPPTEVAVAKAEGAATHFWPYFVGVIFLLAGLVIYLRGRRNVA